MKHKPLLRIILMITACLFVLTACSEKSQITMTTQGTNTIEISLYGTGAVTIDWGDGKSDTYTLSDSVDFLLSPPFTHSYSTSTTHTITITGNRITGLGCSGNELTFLDVSKNTTLRELGCSGNQLTSLNVNSNTALILLECEFNQLTTLDVSQNTALTELICISNQLTFLDVSKNTALTHLYCSGNQLTALDVHNCKTLENLACSNNQLTSLDVSKNTALTKLECSFNQLTSLDVSQNTALTDLYCFDNQLTETALNALFGTLPNNMEQKIIRIEGNPGAAACDQSIATAKGWANVMIGVGGVEEEVVPIFGY